MTPTVKIFPSIYKHHTKDRAVPVPKMSVTRKIAKYVRVCSKRPNNNLLKNGKRELNI